MLKYSYNEKKIKSNVKFFIACNPYIIDTKEKEQIRLIDD